METVKEILSLKRQHGCKSITELKDKGINIYQKYFGVSVFCGISYLVDDEIVLPEKLPILHCIADFDSPFNVLQTYLKYNMPKLRSILADIDKRSEFFRSLLKTCRYDEVKELLGIHPSRFGLESYQLSFTDRILICDKNIFDMITPLCVDIKPKYKPINEFWYRRGVRPVNKKLVKYVFKIRDYDVLNDLHENNYQDVVDMMRKYKWFAISYEFYRVFGHLLTTETNVDDIEILQIKKILTTRNTSFPVRRVVCDAINRIRGFTYDFEHPSKRDILEGLYNNDISHTNPYISYKIGKYINGMEINLTQLKSLMYTPFEIIDNNNYCTFDDYELTLHCGDGAFMDRIAKHLPPKLIKVHIRNCKKKSCTIMRSRIVNTKHA